jgi:hypothetical protein
MRPFKLKEREAATRRGLEFIYRTACDKDCFEFYGHDLLNCFYFIYATSSDPVLRRTARRMGLERAQQWMPAHRSLPRETDVKTISDGIHASYATERFGLRSSSLKAELRRAAAHVTAQDYFWFDPRLEPPPDDVTEPCHCGHMNERGRKTCSRCRRRLIVINRYRLWYEALIAAYNSERVGIPVGASYRDILKWLPTLRPYRGRENGDNPDFYDCLYAVTHIVYTLNDYSLYRLSPRWLPQEYAFLKSNLREAITTEDPDMMGEFLDSLRAFGLKDSHPLIRTGMDFLLSSQNPDGSWGDLLADDVYARYHPTWTAIDGLREYRWSKERLSFPRLLPMLRAMNAQQPAGMLK